MIIVQFLVDMVPHFLDVSHAPFDQRGIAFRVGGDVKVELKVAFVEEETVVNFVGAVFGGTAKGQVVAAVEGMGRGEWEWQGCEAQEEVLG